MEPSGQWAEAESRDTPTTATLQCGTVAAPYSVHPQRSRGRSSSPRSHHLRLSPSLKPTLAPSLTIREALAPWPSSALSPSWAMAHRSRRAMLWQRGDGGLGIGSGVALASVHCTKAPKSPRGPSSDDGALFKHAS